MTAGWRRPEGRRPFVWGHRGARRELPENTIAAFERALAHGAEGVELDVRACASGEVVVCHDRDLERVAGDPRRVEVLDWQALRVVDLGGGASVPLLDQALDLVLGAGAVVNVEIKRDVPDLDALVDAVGDLLSRRPLAERERVTVSSFAWAAVERFARRTADAKTAFLCKEAPTEALPRDWGLHPHHTAVTAALVSRSHAEGRYVATWTVNGADDARRVADTGVDIVITDDIPLVLEALEALAR